MDLIVVFGIVAVAAGYAVWKAWGLFKPGAKAGGCGCGHAKSGCAGCPLTKP